MGLFYCLFICLLFMQTYHGKIFDGCRFVQTFYRRHSNIFILDRNQTSLIVRPLYALSNQSFSSLSIGIIYRLADTYLVPVPLLFECPQSQRIYAPIDCQFTINDVRSNLSIRTSESSRITTVPLRFQEYSSSNSIPIRGAYFKQSTIALRNCRLDSKENLFTSDIFYLQIEFEQTIDSSCQHSCIHPELYECSNTCQCRSQQFGIEKFEQFCIDTELGSNCSLTPERCRRMCRISEQIQRGRIDSDCQCPLGMQRVLSNNMYHCESPASSECMNEKPIESCPIGYICQHHRCVQTSVIVRLNESILSLPFVLIGLLSGALLIIILLIIGLIKMRSIRCVKFVHSYGLPIHSNNSSPILNAHLSSLSSPSSTLSSSPKSMNKTCEKYVKIHLFE
ncbi:unnamed protein product [Rotaria magnacalcarata]|uniref:Uncharacterized protein n=5 Tax=Rotaria magnacalcarata TaxID=392030 RepID=A0A817AIY8_9BILA|nr:unnamed protein product [Rotaria magnacalcarata]